MNVPKRYHGKTFKDFNGLKDEVGKMRLALSENKGIFLSGSAGIGKTHLAVALLVDWLMFRKPEKINLYPKFISSVELLLELRSTFNNDQSEQDVIKKYASIDLLCIDDIGAEKISDWTRQAFYAVLGKRYNEMKQTIITSNLSLEDIAKNIDERISSRIAEMCEVFELQGKDYRLKI